MDLAGNLPRIIPPFRPFAGVVYPRPLGALGLRGAAGFGPAGLRGAAEPDLAALLAAALRYVSPVDSRADGLPTDGLVEDGLPVAGLPGAGLKVLTRDPGARSSASDRSSSP